MQFRKHLRLRSPEGDVDTGGGAGAGAGAGNGAVAPQRPEGLPDDYWDAEKGVKFDALLPQLKSYSDYRASVPTKAEDLDFALPKDIDPDNPNTVYEIDKNDPLVGEVTKVALEHGIPKQAVAALTTVYARQQIEAAKATKAALHAEEKKLGDKFMERVNGAMTYVAGVVGKERAERFRNTWVTAEQVEIIEALAKHAAGPNGASGADPANPNAESTGRRFFSGMASSETKK